MAEHHYLERPAVKAKVLSFVLEGKSDAQVAAAVSTRRTSVTRQAITAFRARHQDEIAPLVAEVEKQITDYAIASKVNRIAALDKLRSLIEADVDEYGVTVTETTTEKDGDKETVTVTRDFRSALVRELRGIMRDAAEELGQMPKEPAVSVNVGVAVALSFEDGSPA